MAYARNDKHKLLALLLHWRVCRNAFQRIKRNLRASPDLIGAVAAAKQCFVVQDTSAECVYKVDDFPWLLRKLGLWADGTEALIRSRVNVSGDAAVQLLYVRRLQADWWSLYAICSVIDAAYRRMSPHQRQRHTYPKRFLRKP